MKKIILTLSMVCLSFSSSALAQDDAITPVFWEAKLAGGEYLVDINKIHSVSIHTYQANSINVTEVVIDTGGDSLARFYAFSASEESDDPIQRIEAEGKNLLNESDPTGAQQKVGKEYPHTTHAKTVEYNLGSSAAVAKLYKSIKSSWKKSSSNTFTSK